MVDSSATKKILWDYARALRRHGRMEGDIIAELQDLGVTRADAKEILASLREAGVTIECHRVFTILGWISIAVSCVVTFSLSVAFTYFFRPFAYKWIVVAIALPPALLAHGGLVVTMKKLGFESSKIVRPPFPNKDEVRRKLRNQIH